MKKDNRGEANKVLFGLVPDYPPWMLTTGKTTLIPRHVITHIQVFPIRIDGRMPTSQRHRPIQAHVFQHGAGAINNPHISDTDLHLAARCGSVSQAQEAVTGNRELMKCQNAKGNLPLHLAVEKGHKKVALYLVGQYPQGSYVLNSEGSSPFYLAVEGRHVELVDFMFQKLASDGDLFSRLNQGKPIVHAAISNHNQEMLQMILKHQPELIKTYDAEGRTPLSCAAYHSYGHMVEYLLKEFPKSKSWRDQDSSRSNAIHKACQRGHKNVLMVFHSLSPNSLLEADRYGRTLLHVAAKEHGDKLKDIVSYLVSLGEIGKMLLSKKDENNRTPLDLAKSSNNHEIINILKQYDA